MKKILLVEDNNLILEMLAERLHGQGYAVVGAEDGHAAIAMAKEQQPDIILMDLALPEMDGWTAAHEIRQMPETRRIPIIALTAHTTGEERDRSYAAGCDDFEVKPIQFERLMKKIRQWTGESGPEN
jgi:CheY-like chemotaxis protein